MCGGSILSCCPRNPHGHDRTLKEEEDYVQHLPTLFSVFFRINHFQQAFVFTTEINCHYRFVIVCTKNAAMITNSETLKLKQKSKFSNSTYQ